MAIDGPSPKKGNTRPQAGSLKAGRFIACVSHASWREPEFNDRCDVVVFFAHQTKGQPIDNARREIGGSSIQTSTSRVGVVTLRIRLLWVKSSVTLSSVVNVWLCTLIVRLLPSRSQQTSFGGAPSSGRHSVEGNSASARPHPEKAGGRSAGRCALLSHAALQTRPRKVCAHNRGRGSASWIQYAPFRSEAPPC
jgi:hypothetical protein